MINKELLLQREGPFGEGYTIVTEETEDIMMEFGILKLKASESYISSEERERTFLLMNGKVEVNIEDTKFTMSRKSLLYESPYCIHVPKKVSLKLNPGIDTEIAVIKTKNSNDFPVEYYDPSKIRSEARGKGTMLETSTRTVRTVFDKSNSPDGNLVIGEVVNYPGKWSSYPPHYHEQPEIYHYRFFPADGFGASFVGDEAYKIKNNSTIKIPGNKTHPQVSAPGYAMYYIWVIRHIDNNPYIEPAFDKKYLWAAEREDLIYPNKKY